MLDCTKYPDEAMFVDEQLYVIFVIATLRNIWYDVTM